MPLDGTDLRVLGDPRLDKLGEIERLLINERQWCKHRLRDEHGRYCLAGAMRAVQARQLLEPIILRAARKVGGRRYWRIESFNDHPSTTHADILRVLQQARGDIIAGMIESRPRPWYARWARRLPAARSSLRTVIASAARVPKGRSAHGADTATIPSLGSSNEASPVREICEIPR
jgi:hypothetical protein